MDNPLSGLRTVDLSGFPDFYSMSTPLEMGLWILWVAKDRGLAQQLSAEQIAQAIVEVYEVSIEPRTLTNALNRSGGKVHASKNAKITFFNIMQSGKEFIRSTVKNDLTNMFYFEPGKRFNSKRILSYKILDLLRGEIKIVDPYCGERTLDILGRHKSKVKILTRLDNLSVTNRSKLVREIADFKSEYSHVEFRDYSGADIHDRYMLTDDELVVLGNSINNLGGKESTAIILKRESNQNIFDAILENFNRRWKVSTLI